MKKAVRTQVALFFFFSFIFFYFFFYFFFFFFLGFELFSLGPFKIFVWGPHTKPKSRP